MLFYSVFVFMDYLTLPTEEALSEPQATNEPTSPSNDNDRFDLYSDATVLSRINAINNELMKHDNLAIDTFHLKNFIYLMNGNYSLAKDLDRDFYDIIDVFGNIKHGCNQAVC